MSHMFYNCKPKLPPKLLVIAVPLLRSHQGSNNPQDLIQGMAKSCYDYTHPWEKACTGLGGSADCCRRQLAIPEIAGCYLLRAQGGAWLTLHS